MCEWGGGGRGGEVGVGGVDLSNLITDIKRHVQEQIKSANVLNPLREFEEKVTYLFSFWRAVGMSGKCVFQKTIKILE